MKRIRVLPKSRSSRFCASDRGRSEDDRSAAARKHGISEATLYNWKTKYGGMEMSDAKRLRSLEEENRKLKKLLAESRCWTRRR